ncbi:MAG: hypothetical protein WCX81_03920 [Monoglobales bacterium]
MSGDIEKALELLMTMLGNKQEEQTISEPVEEYSEINEIAEDNQIEYKEEEKTGESTLQNMLGAFSGGGDKRVSLLSSIKPYMSEKRRSKVDMAITMVKLLQISSGLGFNPFEK